MSVRGLIFSLKTNLDFRTVFGELYPDALKEFDSTGCKAPWASKFLQENPGFDLKINEPNPPQIVFETTVENVPDFDGYQAVRQSDGKTKIRFFKR